MQPLSLISAYTQRPKEAPEGVRPVAINLVTNFTDDVLERLLGGLCMSEGLYPTITRAPYKQYAFALKDDSSEVYSSKPTISFFLFDASSYKHSEFLDASHRQEVLEDIEHYAKTTTGSVVVSLFALPYQNAHGHFFTEDPLFIALSDFNAKLVALSKSVASLYVFDPAKVLHQLGEAKSRDMRGHQAFDMPYTTDFLLAVSSEWLAYVRASLGLSRKCIVLDLDNTLWGGVVGEDGPLGISLGTEYPGSAFVNFQRALLALSERGIILAIVSKNNEADVRELFATNPHMILKEEYFAAVRANWDSKATNLQSIAEELNIGLDAMVFIDDSPVERAEVRETLPQVLVPEWSFSPEEYTPALLALNVFHQMSLTEEDKKKAAMYRQEAERKKVLSTTKNIDEYIAKLNIVVTVKTDQDIDVARAAQLTQKTNQYNITTRRYTEKDIQEKIANGALVATGAVTDTFGAYGVVVLAIIEPSGIEAELDTFLMSCRVMGRGVERAFFEHLLKKLHTRGVQTLNGLFIQTAKNTPAANFLPAIGFAEVSANGAEKRYVLQLEPMLAKLTAQVDKPIITVL